ncbi:MAG: hypothetical protein ACKVVP_07055 [Chloroflexota bacterium]
MKALQIVLRPLLMLLSLATLATGPWPTPAYAQTIPEACVKALAMDARRWDGVPMDVFIWDGAPIRLGEIDLAPVSLCRAEGPLEILPPAQLIGCVLVGVEPTRVGDDLACGAYRDIRLFDETTLLWVARSSAASNEVTALSWTGIRFERKLAYVACWDDPLTPITDPVECGR